MKGLGIALIIGIAVFAGSPQPASAQTFFDNIRDGLNNIAKPPPERKRAQQAERPKFLESLKRTFNDLNASQRNPGNLPKKFERQVVHYPTREAAGTIVISPREHFLYFVTGDGKAIRYGVGVGREGFGWRGTTRIGRKAEWP